MADIEVSFEADDGPIRGVIGRLSRDIVNFAKRSEAAFGSIQSGIQGIGRAGSLSERALEGQRKKLEAIQKASRFETRSSSGFDDRQIVEIQKALTSSASEARELSQEFSQQNGYLRDQVAQYERVLRAQRKINDLVGQQGGVRAIEAQAKPQLTSQPTNSLGLTDGQVAAIQAALAQSVTSARQLTAEFIRQNAAVSQSKDIVVRQGSDMVKFGKSSQDSFGKARKGALALANGFGVIEGELLEADSAVVKFEHDIIDVEEVTDDLGDNMSKSGNKAKKPFQELRDLFNGLSTGDLPALRYALYDIGNNLQRAGLALSALGIAPLVIAAKYEKEFANVIRTNDLARDDVGDLQKSLRNDLKRIAQTTPINWEDITNIATLAGQLGIAQESVGNFTETVAKFAATTDLSVDAAATAFGRLDQLVKGIDGNFENLGSAILAVGVDSVATESAIVNVATQIASMGNLAGLTGSEIVGLSGAMASLGIRPELARGNVTRLFSRIGQAASTSGQEVNEFGRLTGRTAEEFVSDWGTRPGAVLQDFFDGINKEGPEAERTLRSLGITSVRDIPAILRLAQSSDEVRRLIRLSTAEYVKASEITKQYGIISGTVSANITRLVQNFEILQSSVGASVNSFGALIGILNNAVQGFNFIIDNPVGAVISGIVLAVILLAGGFALMVAQAAFLSAGFLAVALVSRKLGVNLKFTQVMQLLFKKGVDETSASLLAQAKAAGLSKVKLDALAVSLQKGAIGARIFKGALRSLLISTGIGIAIVAVTAAIGYFVDKASQADVEAEDLYGSLEGLSEALVKDGKAFDDVTGKMKDGSNAFVTYTKNLDKVNDNLADLLVIGDDAIEGQEALTETIEKGNEALEKQEKLILAASDNVFDFFKNAALRDEDLVRLFGDPRILQAASDTGTGIRELFESAIAGVDVGPQLDAIGSQLEQELSRLQAEYEGFNYTGGKGSAGGQEVLAQIEEIEAALARLDSAEIFFDGIPETIEEVAELATGVETFNGEMEIGSELAAFLTDDLAALNKVLFQEAKYVGAVEKSLVGLAKGFAEGTEEAQRADGAIGNVVEQILNAPDGDVDVILGNLAGLLALLEAQGPKTANAQKFVRDSIREVGDQARLETADVLGYARALNATVNYDAVDFQELVTEALKKTGDKASGASKKIKTLSEQFDDLVESMFATINLGRETEDAIFALGEAFGETGDNALYASDEMQDAVDSILQQSGSAEEGVANLAALFSGLADKVGNEAAPSLDVLRRVISQVAEQFGISEAQAQAFIDTAGGGISEINFDNFNRGIQNAQQEIRTLSDYASDLESVVSRAFDIRYSSTLEIDNIAEAWFKLTDQVEDARKEIEDLIVTQEGLSADRSLKEYFLSIADAYGDTLRAGILREELSALNEEQKDNAKAIAEAQAIAGGDLTGQGSGERQNRSALLGLVGDYQSYITTLAESGASQDELRKATERARKEFIAQALELGYQEDVVLQYAQAFDDVKTAIDRVPRNITVGANVNPALQALNELNAKLNESISLASRLNQVQGQPTPSAPSGPSGTQAGPAYTQPGFRPTPLLPVGQKPSSALQAGILGIKTNTVQINNVRQADLTTDKVTPRSSFNYLGFSSGGYTGPGGKMQPAGIVHKGEYVVPQKYVNQSTGLPDANFLSQLQNGMRGYAQGGFVGGGMGDGTMMVELSPYDRKLLADAGNVQLRVDGKVVASATNRSNFNEARRGSN